jgi:hypothetical protein
MALTQPGPKQLARLALVFEAVIWIVVGGMAMLWWLPERMGEKSTISWQQGALFYGALWVWILNEWPRLGTRRFFRDNAFLAPRLILMGIVSAGFAYGFLSAA